MPDPGLVVAIDIWADGRASVQARRLRDSGQWLGLHRRTGTPVHPMSPLVKLLWFREEQPHVWQRAAHWQPPAWWRGAVAPGVAACSIGTSAAIRGVVPAPRVDEQGRVFCYVLVPDRRVVGGATNNGGNVLRWLGRVAGADLADPDSGLSELAASVPPGAEELLMLPYLSGERAPRWAGAPTAAYLGLTQRHTWAHLARAALEGVCLQLALVLEAMAAAGLELTELRATGGFARSPFWRQLLADVLGTTIRFPASEQGSALGAALLGHVALGHLRSVDDAAALVRITEVVHPDPEAARFYQQLLPAFAATANAVQDLSAWRFDEAPDDATLVATGQTGKEDES